MRWTAKLMSRLSSIAAVVILAIALVAGYRLTKWHVTSQIYRRQLGELSAQYDQLLNRYNQVVRQTAVTELLVQHGQVSVRIRNAQGVVRTIPTPYHADDVIYVDFVVTHGRLFIRRIFNEQTPPTKAVTINPKFAEVDWNDPTLEHGKAVYHQLSEGRWVVTVTGDGSLGLKKVTGDDEPALAPPPKVQAYAQLIEKAQARVRDVGPLDVLWELLGG